MSPSAKVWGVDLTLEAPRTAFIGPCLTGARSTAYANAQAFPTDGANCKDSIRNDPKLVLGSHV